MIEIFGSELLLQAAEVDVQSSDRPTRLIHRNDHALAPGEELRVGFDVRDERIHFLCAMPYECRSIDDCHRCRIEQII